MPYTIKKSKSKKDDRPYKIVNTQTGKVVGSSKTKRKAVGSMMHREDAMMKKEGSMKKEMSKKTVKKTVKTSVKKGAKKK